MKGGVYRMLTIYLRIGRSFVFMDTKLLSFCHFQIQMTQSFYFLNTNNADDTDKYKKQLRITSASFASENNQNKSQVRISSLQ